MNCLYDLFVPQVWSHCLSDSHFLIHCTSKPVPSIPMSGWKLNINCQASHMWVVLCRTTHKSLHTWIKIFDDLTLNKCCKHVSLNWLAWKQQFHNIRGPGPKKIICGFPVSVMPITVSPFTNGFLYWDSCIPPESVRCQRLLARAIGKHQSSRHTFKSDLAWLGRQVNKTRDCVSN